jgi:alanine-glyoxylate transaminase / serine-glyoxylate transaminase / serine-pyruvate transaminase
VRLLLGSGPSPVPQRVLDALARPTLGHLDPAFGEVLDGVSAMLRELFGTTNDLTLPLSATGSGGMQMTVDALVAPGDRVVCGVHGLFGLRMADALRRRGAEVVEVTAPWGRALDREALAAAVRAAPTRALFVVHGETSTGVCQPLEGLGELDCLLLVDCVTSLGGQPLAVDALGIDAAFSGSQKTLNCPPGLAPFTVRDGLVREGSPSWYFDLAAAAAYYRPDGAARAYHHTAPTNMVVALHEALRLVLDEGLEARWARHAERHAWLRDALAELGLERLAPEDEALWPLLCVRLPERLREREAEVRRALLLEDGIEVSGGLGPLAGQVWRIGVMGEGARPEHQERLVAALRARL